MRVLCFVCVIACASLAAAAARAESDVFAPTRARQCYEAAEAASGTGAALCERALSEETLTPRDKAATLVNRGIIYNAARQNDLALADFNAALAIDPYLAEAYLNRGNTYFLKRQLPDALADYNKAIDLKVATLDYARYNRALVEQLMGRLDDAKTDLQAALAITPDFRAASERLSLVDKLLAERAAAAAPPTPADAAAEPVPAGGSPAQ